LHSNGKQGDLVVVVIAVVVVEVFEELIVEVEVIATDVDDFEVGKDPFSWLVKREIVPVLPKFSLSVVTESVGPVIILGSKISEPLVAVEVGNCWVLLALSFSEAVICTVLNFCPLVTADLEIEMSWEAVVSPLLFNTEVWFVESFDSNAEFEVENGESILSIFDESLGFSPLTPFLKVSPVDCFEEPSPLESVI